MVVVVLILSCRLYSIHRPVLESILGILLSRQYPIQPPRMADISVEDLVSQAEYFAAALDFEQSAHYYNEVCVPVFLSITSKT